MRLAAALAILWIAGAAGCSSKGGDVLGADPGAGKATSIRELKAGETVLLTGTMIEKCPTAGCWFMLKDSTGVVRVDTKAANFTVTDVAVNSRMTVRGVVKEGSERIVAASGLRL